MLGNFCFGDYFKKEAIAFAWELVTSPKWIGIAKDKLYVTIFKGEQGMPRDDEAYEHWTDRRSPQRIYEMGMKDNFWQMGDTGPCGPCSELHYDMGRGQRCRPPIASSAASAAVRRDLEPGVHAVQPRPDGGLAPAAQRRRLTPAQAWSA